MRVRFVFSLYLKIWELRERGKAFGLDNHSCYMDGCCVSEIDLAFAPFPSTGEKGLIGRCDIVDE